MGIVSLLEDRQNDFAQEIVVSPTPATQLFFGKILGESLVAIAQGVGSSGLVWYLACGFPRQVLMPAPGRIIICIFPVAPSA